MQQGYIRLQRAAAHRPAKHRIHRTKEFAGMTDFNDYKDSFVHYKLEREDGVVTITMHKDGGEMVWSMPADAEMGAVLEAVGRDPETKVVILTGTGDTFIHYENFGGDVDSLPASMWAGVIEFAARLLNAHLNVPAPMIAAVNGPNTIHPDLALLCDIVLASEDAAFADMPHFPSGLVPGDGIQVVLPLLMGFNRARYAMLTGQLIGAQEAKEMGLVNEVLPKAQLLDRAHELAAQLLKAPPVTLALTRGMFTSQIRQMINASMGQGLAAEGLAATAYWPREFASADLSQLKR